MHTYISILPLALAIPLTFTGAIAAHLTPATVPVARESISFSQTIAQTKNDDADDCSLRGCGRRYQNTSDRGSGRIQKPTV